MQIVTATVQKWYAEPMIMILGLQDSIASINADETGLSLTYTFKVESALSWHVVDAQIRAFQDGLNLGLRSGSGRV